MVALSFANDSETHQFYESVSTMIANRTRKVRRGRKFSPTKDVGPDTGYDSRVVLRNKNSTGITRLNQLFRVVVIFRKKCSLVFKFNVILILVN